jgi:hypothetical protein
MKSIWGLLTATILFCCVPVLADQCDANYKSSGSVFKGKRYETFVDYPGLDQQTALRRMAAQMPEVDITVTTEDDAAGTLSGVVKLSPTRSAPIEVKATSIDGGTRISFSVAFPAGVMGNHDTKEEMCRIVQSARIDPASRFRNPLILFVRDDKTQDQVSVVDSNSKKRYAKVAGGALLGALAGAAHAKLTGGDIGKEAAIGAIAGGAIAFGITKFQDKRLANRNDVMQAESYDPAQGYRAGVRMIDVSPLTVKPGGTITVTTRYWALTPGANESFNVYRYAGISVSGVYLRGFRFNPEPFQFSDGGGEYQTTMDIQLPESVSPGPYSVHWVVDGQSTGGDVETTFNVAG